MAPESQFRRTQRFRIRARFAGMLYWTCPSCGGVNDARFTPGKFRVRCSKSGCARRLMVGLIFYDVAPGVAGVGCPPDVFIPAEDPMPECEIVGTWSAGEPVHRFVEESARPRDLDRPSAL